MVKKTLSQKKIHEKRNPKALQKTNNNLHRRLHHILQPKNHTKWLKKHLHNQPFQKTIYRRQKPYKNTTENRHSLLKPFLKHIQRNLKRKI
jgi:hypothetical protein